MNSLTDPKFKAFDANGDPLSGGLLFTYEDGTTTKKTTYSDAALTSANANPVVLDSRGEAKIFGNGTFTFVLAPSTDTDPPSNAIWTVDGVFAASSVTDSSGNVVVTSTDAGATAGPYLKLYRNSATPADNDLLGSVLFEGKNDNSERITYGELKVKLIDASDGTEDAELGLWTMVAGTLTEVATVLPTGIDSDIASADGSVVLTTGAANTAATLVLATEGLQLWDTDDSHKLSIVVGSNLSANRNLTFTTGDAARTITINGNPTLNDWFDQDLQTTASPTFVAVTANLTGNVTGDVTGDVTGNITGAFFTANDDNVYGGYQAQNSITTGANNTSVGYQAQSSLTSGSDNTAFGYQAMDTNDVGSRNTALGALAGAQGTYNSGSDDSVFIGYNAGYAINYSSFVAQNNTIIGSQAGTSFGGSHPDNMVLIGYNCEGGDSAVVIGSGADANINSVALGYGSWAQTSSVAIGYQATMDTGAGSKNISIGYQADCGDGDNNVTIGADAGTGYTGSADGSNNILIGYNAEPPTASTDNQCVLGDANIADLRCQDTTITAVSDERDKEDIADLPVSLDFINSLRPVNYRLDMRAWYFDADNPKPNKVDYQTPQDHKNAVKAWKGARKAFFKNPVKDGTKKRNRLESGFIAQEFMAAALANNVDYSHVGIDDDESKEQYHLGPGALIPFLVKAIQELTARIETLENP